MEKKTVTIEKSTNTIKYGSLLYAVLYIILLSLELSMDGLYLRGSVRLGNEDELFKTFSIDVPFQHSHIMFSPEHHFSIFVYWSEVKSQFNLILYVFFKNLTQLLAIFSLFFIYIKAKKYKTRDDLSLIFTKKRLIILTVASFLLENVGRICAEYYKISFFQKYLSFKDAHWYLYNDTFGDDLTFSGPLLNIYPILLIFIYSFKELNNAKN